MRSDIYTSLKNINDSSRFSLQYMSLLNKISYESLRTMFKRNSKIQESLSYQIVLNYNLTLKQLEELKNEEKYHKMIDHKYYWNIIYYVNSGAISKQVGLNQISAILANADGTYNYLNKELSFNPKYDLRDYLKYSTSLIVINKEKKIRNNILDPISASIEEEITIINSLIDKINNYFSKDILKDIFYFKYILGLNAKSIQKHLKINNNRYYRLLSETNKIAYEAFGLYLRNEIRGKMQCLKDF